MMCRSLIVLSARPIKWIGFVTTFRLDETEWRILRELQEHGRLTNVELARRVGISAPPCLRRMRALEEAGVIEGYHALISQKSLGYEVSAFAMVGLSRQSENDLRAFEEQVRQWRIVRECHMLSGEIDFILKCIAPDLEAFQDFIINDLTAARNVDSVKTSLVIRRAKYEIGPPLPAVAEQC